MIEWTEQLWFKKNIFLLATNKSVEIPESFLKILDSLLLLVKFQSDFDSETLFFIFLSTGLYYNRIVEADSS